MSAATKPALSVAQLAGLATRGPAVDDAAGLFGPGSMAWRVDREVLVLAGGSCALLMQAAHPAVAAGVAQHSGYRHDPIGRLLRTLSSSFAVVFGTRRQAVAAIRRVNAVHASVRGRVPETGEPYSALAPDALLWVHATLVDTALRIYDRFVAELAPEEMEAYYRECAPVAELLGVPSDTLPATQGELRSWMDEMIGAGHVHVTPTALDIARTIVRPTRFPPGFVWDAAHLVSLSMLPDPLRRQYGIGWSASRERGVERLAAVTRRVLPWVPAVLRFVPHARSAEARVARAHARVAGAGAGARSRSRQSVSLPRPVTG
ncbi:MAG: oxygenase MpaB family protein [Candidatus Limnocylindria bacterium]